MRTRARRHPAGRDSAFSPLDARRLGRVRGQAGIVDRIDDSIDQGHADGVARVCTGCAIRREEGDEHSEVEGGLWGYVDREGRVVVPAVHALGELPAPPAPGPG